MKYSGKTKLAFCERLGDEWKKVADFVEIPVSDQDSFASGDQARAIWHWLERREALAKLSDALRYARRPDLVDLLEPEVPPVQSGGPTWVGCPYPGLLSFKPREAPIFFGRTRETAELLERLRQPDNRFLAVVGASGSGKSSLVKAGVIPQLEAKGGWLCTRLTPGEVGDDPFLALATALKPLLQGQYDSVRQIHVRLTDTGDIASLVRAALANQAAAELLVFLDQFEELFTLAAEAHRLPFTILLDRMASTPGLRTLVTLPGEHARALRLRRPGPCHGRGRPRGPVDLLAAAAEMDRSALRRLSLVAAATAGGRRVGAPGSAEITSLAA